MDKIHWCSEEGEEKQVFERNNTIDYTVKKATLFHEAKLSQCQVVCVCILEGEVPLTTGLALQSPPLVLQPNSTGHQLQFKKPTQEEQLERSKWWDYILIIVTV